MSELKQALGTSLDIPAKKQAISEPAIEGSSTEKPISKEANDGLVYTDSSTFLKVFINELLKHVIKLDNLLYILGK